MARPRAADYDDKRTLIMEKAAFLFARDGFAATSLSGLAEACGVSKSLIYHYYPSKEAILYDVMRGHMDDLLSAIDAEIPVERSEAASRFRSFTRDLLRRYTGAAAKQKVLLYELGNLPAARHEDIVEKQRRLIDFVVSLLAAAPEAAKNRPRLRAKAMLYFGMLNWTHTWFRPDGPVSRDAVADLAAELVLGSPG